MATITHPWQRGPTELISFALDHLHREAEADHRVAFLLLDVGVETLFKTFLSLPDRTIGTKLSFAERKEAAKGNFHDLCNGVDRAAGTRLQGINIAHVQFYHDLRNKLYHEGGGINVSTGDVRGYAKVSVDLLKRLLDVDLDEELRKPEIEALRAAEEKAKREREKREIEEQTAQVKQARRALAQTAAMAIEKLYPQLCMPRFVNSFNILQYLAKREKEAQGWQLSYTEEEQNWRENGSSLATPEVERARAALANAAKHQDIHDIEDYYNITEFYLGLVERIVQLILGDETTSPGDWAIRLVVYAYVEGKTTRPGDWAIAYRQSADYPADAARPIVFWDDDAQETVEDIPSSEDIIQVGQKWVLGLDQIRHQIDTASRDPRFVPPVKQRDGKKSKRVTGENESGIYEPYGIYEPFLEWMRARPEGEAALDLSFQEIEKIIGGELPPSAHKYREWWANHERNAQAKAWLRGGWRVANVDLTAREVTFQRSNAVLMQQFFDDLLHRLKKVRPGATQANKTQPMNWFSFGAGRAGFSFGWSFGKGDVLRVELYTTSQDKEVNRKAFEALEKQRAEIEGEIAMALIWEPRPDNVQKLIRVTHAAKITDEPKELESAKQWAVETMVKFIDVFTPRIRNLEY